MTQAEARDRSPREPRPWRRAAGWLAFLAPFFYVTYGAATYVTTFRRDVPSITFAWEHGIPFVGWTIIPYWSINLFYALSVFVCATSSELNTHVRRLLTAQVVAVVCFLLFPLRFTFPQPSTNGFAGFLFAVLTSFDKPFNQAPSLHIALLVILWFLYERHVPRVARWPLRLWLSLVGVSVLTTYQHHFVDIPTGALLGLFCLWLWPDRERSPLEGAAFTRDSRRLALAGRYVLGAISVVALALWIGGAGLWLMWLAVSLLLVASNYAVFGPAGFQKDADGHMSLAARLLLAPYLAGAFVNSRLWTRREPRAVEIGDGVWLGRIPSAGETDRFATVVDLCAELPGVEAAGHWTCIPMLDLVVPPPTTLRQAAAVIERRRPAGPILVCCALGYSRSVATVATWLVTSHAARSMSDAVETIRRARPRIVVDSALSAAIAAASERTL